MYSSQLTDPIASLNDSRITRIRPALRAIRETTLDAYQAQVYSTVNGILNLNGKMQPVILIPAEVPATSGTVTSGMLSLAADANDLVAVVTSTESMAARLYNLGASTQNQIRQKIRETFYASNASRFLEPFLNTTQITSNTGTVDFTAGVETLPEISTTQVVADLLSAGPGSTAGAAAAFASRPASLAASTSTVVPETLTSVTFNGSHLELVASFNTPVILNRVKIELADYAGLELSTLTSSPDGNAFQDVLADLGQTALTLSGISGKLSGAILLDFPPRYVSQLRLVFNNRIGTSYVKLKSISFWKRQFSATAELVSKLVTSPLGELTFTADQHTWGNFTTITHQVSNDGVHYTAILPGDTASLLKPFYYRAQLQRVASAFSTASSPISQDPSATGAYILSGTKTLNLGSNLLQRTLEFGSISGPVTLQELPLAGTFRVLQGSAKLDPSAYTYANQVLSFPAEIFSITVSYQTSNLGSSSIAALQPFYTPVLREVLFSQS